MCRTKDEREDRCPCDTSEARRLRRHNNSAKEDYAALATKPVEFKTLPTVEPTEPYTVESVREEIASLNALAAELRKSGATSNEVFSAYDKKLNTVGAGVEYLAETKYGALKDEEMAALIEKATLKIEKARKKQRFEDQDKSGLLGREKVLLEKQLNVHADVTTHPSLEERHAVWEENDPETFAAWKAKQAEFKAAVKIVVDGPDPQIARAEIIAIRKKFLEQRNEAMISALKDVGVEFANPDSIEVSEDSTSAGVDSLKSALSYYPQSWVDASNLAHRDRPLQVTLIKDRAHYIAAKVEESYSDRTMAWVVHKPRSWKPDPHDRHDSEFISMEGKSSWTDPKSGVVHQDWDRQIGKAAWISVSYDYYDGKDVPQGDWEKVEHYEMDEQGRNRTGNMVTRYRKPKMRRRQNENTVKSELTVNNAVETYVGTNAGMRVAMHEFGHRVEHVHPIVTAYQEAFLKRRAGMLPSGDNATTEPEQLTEIFNGNKEYGYKDNFPNHYMGKVYDTSSHKEIFSMGMETLFAGKNGAFAGIGKYKADADYKKFMLGVLASSAK